MKCKNCKKTVPKGRIRFCSDKCRLSFHSRNQYKRIKNDPIYKAKKKISWNKWYQNNREEFNDTMRPINKLAQAKRRTKWKESGLCTKCGKSRKNKDYLTCERCRT